MRSVMLLIVGVVVVAMLGQSGVTSEEVLTKVGAADFSNALSIAQSGFQQASAFFAKVNAR